MKKAPFRAKRPGTERLVELLETLLWSGFIEGERPISTILVAPAGAGKTTLLEAFDSDYSPFLSDVTSRELSATLREKKEARHILIGDLMSVLRHKKGTTALTINMLSQLSGDTMRQDAFTGDNVRKRMGVISAIPPEDYKTRNVQKVFQEGGFASRFLIAKYVYTPTTISRIHKYIASGAYRFEGKGPRLIRVGPPQREIKMSPFSANHVRDLALVVRRDPIGARAHHYLRTLAMSIAARDASRHVLARHLRRLDDMAEFFTERGVEL